MEQLQFILDRLEKIENKQDEKLDKILIQTTRTNGRVLNLEKTVSSQGDILGEHEKIINKNEGRDSVVKVIIGAIAAVGGMGIGALISKFI